MANRNLANAVRIALLSAGAAGTGLVGASAYAQDGAAPLEEIVVTGTRVRSPGLISSSPISSVDDFEIGLRQPVTVEEFVRTLSAAVPAAGPGTNNGSPGAATVDLRGLGSNRNLVLVNGRRVTPFNLGGSVNTDNIPVAMIERVDLVTGGASAVYGADAITGVLNFILRRDFEGIDFSTSYGVADEGDGDRFRADLTFGANTSDGRGNVTMSVGYTKTDPVLQGDRTVGLETFNSVSGQPFGSIAAAPVVTSSPGILGGARQLNPATGAYEPIFNIYNFNPPNLFQTPLERTQFTALANYEIAPFAEAYAEMFYTTSEVVTNLAPSATFGAARPINIGNPFIPEPARQQLCAGLGVDPEACVSGTLANPGEQFIIPVARRFTEFGPRINVFDNEFFQYNLGVRGDINPSWGYDVSWSYGESQQTLQRIQWGSNAKLSQALLAATDPATGEIVCLDPSGGCVPMNVWAAEGGITDEMLGFIDLNAILGEKVQQEVGGINFSGDLGGLRSPLATDGPIGVAFGFEHRRTSAFTNSDAASQIQGEVLGTGAPRPDRGGSFKLNELYVEAIVPLITGMPGINSLTLDTGIRHTEFSTDSSDNYRSWKAGLSWEPTNDLLVRMMFQRATRAPNVNELFAPLVTGLSNLDNDPCAGPGLDPANAGTPGTLENLCVQTGVDPAVVGLVPQPTAGQINLTSGGNPALGPEVGSTFTFGGVWQTDIGLTLTADYWRVKVSDAVSSPSSSDIVEDCFDPARNPGFGFVGACANVDRSPTDGGLSSGGLGIITALSNLGYFKTDGIDVNALYGFDFANPALGRMDFNLNLTHVLSYEQQPTPASTLRDCLGKFSTSCSSLIPKWKGNLRTTWSLADYSVSLNWRYMSSMESETTIFPDFQRISSYNWFDLTGAWEATDNVVLTLTINNLLDKDPPFVGNTVSTSSTNSGNTFPQWYDAIGRFYTVGVRFNF